MIKIYEYLEHFPYQLVPDFFPIGMMSTSKHEMSTLMWLKSPGLGWDVGTPTTHPGKSFSHPNVKYLNLKMTAILWIHLMVNYISIL